MEKRKVLLVSPSLNVNKNIGGIASVAKFIIENNHEAEYVHFEIGKHDVEKRNLNWFFRILKAYAKWGYIILLKKDLIIHFNFALERRSIIRDSPLIFFAKMLNRKIVLHIHGGAYMERDSKPEWIIKLLKNVFSGYNPKIVMSVIEKEIMITKFFSGNVKVLPNSIELNEAIEFNRKFPTRDPLNILFFGRIDRNKGLDFLLESLGQLKDRNIPFKFIMAGDGPDKFEYLPKFESLLGSNFDYKGVVTGRLKGELLKACDIFVLPSFYEGLPISLLECMSYGLVPLVTSVGSIKDVVKHDYNGIIISQYSSTDITQALERLVLNKNLLEEFGINAKDYIIKHFNPNEYIKELNAIYSSK